MTGKTIGRNVNDTDTAALSAGIPLNATTSTVIAVANNARVYFTVNNNSSVKECWIKLQAASVDDDKKGIFLHPRNQGSIQAWEMPTDNIYTGEISAIADSGEVIVFVTEY